MSWLRFVKTTKIKEKKKWNRGRKIIEKTKTYFNRFMRVIIQPKDCSYQSNKIKKIRKIRWIS